MLSSPSCCCVRERRAITNSYATTGHVAHELAPRAQALVQYSHLSKRIAADIPRSFINCHRMTCTKLEKWAPHMEKPNPANHAFHRSWASKKVRELPVNLLQSLHGWRPTKKAHIFSLEKSYLPFPAGCETGPLASCPKSSQSQNTGRISKVLANYLAGFRHRLPN